MGNSKDVQLTATEIGIIWSLYQFKTMMVRVLEHLLEKSEDKESRKILTKLYDGEVRIVNELTTIFNNEQAAVPVGFTKKDVMKGVPRLFDHNFDLMYIRTMAKISIGYYALYSTMSYRKDIRNLNNNLTKHAQKVYDEITELLLNRGVLVRPPHISMPKDSEFVKDQKYISGFNFLQEKRPLNTIEIGHLCYAIETNTMGIQLMTGYAQAAKNKDVQNYFVKGKELAQKIVTEFNDILMRSDIQAPVTWTAKATDSTTPPFSDKLMMYNTNLLSTFGLGSNVIGGAFSFRPDLPIKLAMLAQDIFTFAKEGGKIMIENNWMEEPPHAEDRNKLTNKNQ
ncbi:DUF3231 family protein [Halobacillus shinanisalinarum]|uniref:DUF3231 family protein n=1 Tax=Halobacillus shinanisalinarum TaxID=2932258 RepID=A0ABY4GXF7_9BACI|nr:DUF3231 family protein [Halobacillus shinanisalinarum]UOQ92102.1 DUF3231 family protein [Halobacillus shinanisalinarum]